MPFVAVRVRLVERLVSFDVIGLRLVAGNASVTHRLRWTVLWLFLNEETRIRTIDCLLPAVAVAAVATIVDGISNVADGRQGVSECCFSHMLWFV